MITKEVERCEACRRKQWRGPAMRTTDVPGIGLTLLCIDPTECRHNWPAEADRRHGTE